MHDEIDAKFLSVWTPCDLVWIRTSCGGQISESTRSEPILPKISSAACAEHRKQTVLMRCSADRNRCDARSTCRLCEYKFQGFTHVKSGLLALRLRLMELAVVSAMPKHQPDAIRHQLNVHRGYSYAVQWQLTSWNFVSLALVRAREGYSSSTFRVQTVSQSVRPSVSQSVSQPVAEAGGAVDSTKTTSILQLPCSASRTLQGFSGPGIKTEGAVAMGNMLKQHTALKKLDLTKNMLTPPAVKHLKKKKGCKPTVR